MLSSIINTLARSNNASETRALITALPLMIVATDSKGIFVEWNHECERVTGFKAEEIIGNPNPSSLLYPDEGYLEDLFEFWKKNKGTYHNEVWKVHCKNGLKKAISWSNISREYPIDGWYSWAIGLDVSELKDFSEKLEKSEDKIRDVVKISETLLTEPDFETGIQKVFEILGKSSGADRIYIFENETDPETDEVFMSQTYEWTKGEVNIQIDNPVLQKLSYGLACPRWQEQMSRKESINGLVKDFPACERDFLEPQGIQSLLAVPVFFNDLWWGFIGFDNCTDDRVYSPAEESMLKSAAIAIGGAIQRENTNRQLLAAKFKAEEMSRLKSNFLANMSHELRTPLIGVLGFAEILKEDIQDTYHRKLAENIYAAGQRLSDSLSLILDLSRIEADRLTLNLEHVDISEIISESISYLESEAKNRGLYIKTTFPEIIPLLKSDRRMLLTIVDNLLSNAIKFTKEGGIHFIVTVDKGISVRRVNIVIRDTGIGISPDYQQLIFDEFRQVSEGLTRSFEGVGLGLTIVKKFTEKLGGQVEMNSQPGFGTTFTISFPVSLDTDTSPDHDSFGNNSSLDHYLPAEKKRILLINQDVLTQTLVRVFTRKFADVEVADNVVQAQEIASKKKIDVALLEINAGNSESGIEILKKLREQKENKNVPFIAFTSYVVSTPEHKFLEAGFNGFIPKPVTKADFLRVLKKFL